MSVNAKMPSVRIIGGQWRSRRINFLEAEGLRPTSDRIRETVFNWLQGSVAGGRCLDLFAGSGVLGFEARSRGASHVTLVEKNQRAYRQIKLSDQQLSANVEVVHGNAFEWVRQNHTAYDLIFFDPPYALNAWETLLSDLIQSAAFQASSMLYLEYPKSKQALLENVLKQCDLAPLKQKKMGGLVVGIFIK